MAMRLEGRNLKYGKNIVSETGVKSNGFIQAETMAGQNSQIVNEALTEKLYGTTFERSVAFGDKLQGSILEQPTISSGGLNLPKPNRLATAKETLQPTKLDYLTERTVDVPVSVIKANPQLATNNDALVRYMNDVNGFANPFIGDKAEPFSRTAKLKGAVVGDLTKAATAIDQFQGAPTDDQLRAASQYDPSGALNIGRVQDAGIADYSADFSNLANTYSAAGYGPATDYSSAQSQYSAGAYGGAGFMSQVSARFLQPTIGMPRIG